MESVNEAKPPESEKQTKDMDNTNSQNISCSTLTPETPLENMSNSVGGENVNNTNADLSNANETTPNTTNNEDSSKTEVVSDHPISHPLELNSDDEDLFDKNFTQPELVLETKNSKGRRVFFPDDGRIVSGYMDPPRPWNDASSCSTDELIQAYRVSCERFGVKPLPRLLQQLQVINDFCDRNETLTMRGERLDYKTCETIEEILRRVQFRTIDLEGTHLEEEGAVALFDMIEYYESCNRLNISNNRTIGMRGWQACARLMKKTPCLENLEARNCTISEQVMPFICRSLRLGATLTTLHLENSISSGRPLIILVTALKMNDILRELYLADNKLMPSDGIQLGNLLRYNFRLQLLDVRNNHLQDVGTSHICDGLWEQNLGKGLATLVLWNNQITYQAMGSLSRALANTKNLETLNLGHNNITNEGIHRLKDGLLQNKSLLRIGLQAAKISCEGAVALAEFIAESPRLLRIDLRENDIKTGGLMALSLSLKVSESVTRIDLDKETKRETSMKDYAEQQRRLLNDISNYMQRNRDMARHREEEEENRQQALLEQKQQQELAAVAQSAPAQTPPGDDDEQQEKSDTSKTEPETEEPPAEETKLPNARPDYLDLGVGSMSLMPDVLSAGGSQTLDSPAYVEGTTLPHMTFTDPITSPVNKSANRLSDSPVPLPLTFPPSPMVSENGRPTLAPILGASPSVMSPTSESMTRGFPSRSSLDVKPIQVARKSPNSSPTMRRKFIISRVQESGKKVEPPTSSADLVVPIINLNEAFDKVSDLIIAKDKTEDSEPSQSVTEVTKDTVSTSQTADQKHAECSNNKGRTDSTDTRSPCTDSNSNEPCSQNQQTNSKDLASELADSKSLDPSLPNAIPMETSPLTDGNPKSEPLVNDEVTNEGRTSPVHDEVQNKSSHNSLQQESVQVTDSKLTDLTSMNGISKDVNSDFGDIDLGQLDLELGNIPAGDTDGLTCPGDFEKELDAMLANMAEPTAS